MARYGNFNSKKLLKELAQSGNNLELRQRLEYYLNEIEKLRLKATLLERQINAEAQLLARASKTTQLSAIHNIIGAKILLNNEINRKESEKIMRESYKLIEELRHEITGQETTFRVLFDVGGKTKGEIYEAAIPLQDILNMSYASESWKASSKNSATAMKLRLGATAAQKKSWVEKYQATSVSKQYRGFEQTLLSNGVSSFSSYGRQYEFFKKSDYLYQLNNTSLSGMKKSISSDNTSFVKGVDFAYQSDTGEIRFESLKSFLGKDPSLASLSTILSTLQKASVAINKMNNPAFIQQYMEQQLSQHEQGLSEAAQASIEQAIPSQVIEPMLEQIFPAEQNIFGLSLF